MRLEVLVLKNAEKLAEMCIALSSTLLFKFPPGAEHALLVLDQDGFPLTLIFKTLSIGNLTARAPEMKIWSFGKEAVLSR